jgi:hypothetical protein
LCYPFTYFAPYFSHGSDENKRKVNTTVLQKVVGDSPIFHEIGQIDKYFYAIDQIDKNFDHIGQTNKNFDHIGQIDNKF